VQLLVCHILAALPAAAPGPAQTVVVEVRHEPGFGFVVQLPERLWIRVIPVTDADRDFRNPEEYARRRSAYLARVKEAMAARRGETGAARARVRGGPAELEDDIRKVAAAVSEAGFREVAVDVARPRVVDRPVPDAANLGILGRGGRVAAPVPAGPQRPHPRDAAVFGVGGVPGVQSVVFVLDAGAAAAGPKDFVLNEVAKAANRLDKTQAFNVLAFGDETAALADGPFAADDDHKTKLFGFLHGLRFRGRGDAAAALRKAPAMKPALIQFITATDLSDEAIAAISDENAKGGKVRINVIALPGAGTDPAGLRRLAEGNGGIFRAIDPEKPAHR
jgi:hypothetical protein